MTDIIKYNIRTYVEELIKKEILSKNNEEKVLSNNGKTKTGEHVICSVTSFSDHQ